MQQKRIKESFFDDDDTLTLNISAKTREVTNLIKASETKLKQLVNCQISEKADEQSKQFCSTHLVRKNMQAILAEKLKSITFDMRKTEKEHFSKVQELHGSSNSHQSDEMFVLDTFEEEEQKVQCSREIQSLAKTISDLAVLFKDLSVLVVEQGTILDRIDYNILDAKQNIEKANVHIETTLKIE